MRATTAARRAGRTAAEGADPPWWDAWRGSAAIARGRHPWSAPLVAGRGRRAVAGVRERARARPRTRAGVANRPGMGSKGGHEKKRYDLVLYRYIYTLYMHASIHIYTLVRKIADDPSTRSLAYNYFYTRIVSNPRALSLTEAAADRSAFSPEVN